MTHWMQHGFVYVLVFRDNICKIGRSDDPTSRIRYHLGNCSLPLNLQIVFAVEDDRKAEKVLLAHFRPWRINDGEWFQIPARECGILKRSGFILDDSLFTRPDQFTDCVACIMLDKRLLLSIFPPAELAEYPCGIS